MGGQNPQDMFKRGMPMLGQVPGAVKKGPLGQLHKDTSELIQSTQKDQSQQQIDSVVTPDEQSFIEAQKVDEQLAQQKEYQDAGFAYPLDETITDKEYLVGKLYEAGEEWSVDAPLQDLQAGYRFVEIIFQIRETHLFPFVYFYIVRFLDLIEMVFVLSNHHASVCRLQIVEGIINRPSMIS